MIHKSFDEIISACFEAYRENNFEEALNILEREKGVLSEEELEENKYDINIYTAAFKGSLGFLEESMNLLEGLIDEGYICPLQWGGICDSFIGNSRFNRIREKNDVLREKLRKDTSFEHEIYLPEGYSEEKKYPLLICLHGDGDNMEYHRRYCPEKKLLQNGIMVVYMQATQLTGHKSHAWLKRVFHNEKKESWPHEEKMYKTSETSYLLKELYDDAFYEIKKCYESIKEQYSIDESRIMVSGFSGGATAAIEVGVSNCIPVKGIIPMSSMKPLSFTPESIEGIKKRGTRFVFIEGELDLPIKDLDHMMKLLDEVGVRHKLHISKGTTHWYPDNIEETLIEAIEFIC